MKSRLLSALRHHFALWVVALVCAVGAGVSGTLLYQDMTGAHRGGNGESVGRVERKQSKARRKSAGSFAWQTVDSDQPLYNRDSVQTGAESSVSIRLKDGSVLELGENSLVVMSESREVALNYLRGSAIVRTDQGDQTVQVSSDGKRSIAALSVRLLEPAPLTKVITYKGPRDVKFAWERKSGDAQRETRLQVASDRAFKRVVSEQAASDAVSVSLKAGKYFWRVIDAQSQGLSETRELRVTSILVPEAVTPSDGQTITVWKEDPHLELKWSVPRSLGDYESLTSQIEIARDPAFANLIKTQPITVGLGALELQGLTGGDYYWRVRVQDGVGTPARFHVAEETSVELAQKLPLEDSMLKIRQETRLAWVSGSDRLNYQVILQDADGKESIVYRGNRREASWRPVNPGLHRWRVRADLAGKTVAESPWRAVHVMGDAPIALESPANAEKIYFWKDPKPFVFRWAADEQVASGRAQFELQVARDASFTALLGSWKTNKTEFHSSETKLAPSGEVRYWRVRVIDSQDQWLAQSAVRSFEFGNPPPLPAPQKVRSDLSGPVDLLKQKEDVEMDWSGVDQAVGYEVVVYEKSRTPADASVTEPKWRAKIQDTSARLPVAALRKLPPGSYHWRVHAVDPVGRAGEDSAWQSLEIKEAAQLGAPKVRSREVQ